MDTQKINAELNRRFAEPLPEFYKRRIIVWHDESQKILSVLRSKGSHTVIDKLTVSLNIKKNVYEAEFSNLGLKGIPIADEYPEKYDRLLCGGIWCIVQLEYEYVEEDKKNGTPIQIRKLTPIQMPHVDINELKEGRKAFTKEEWILNYSCPWT